MADLTGTSGNDTLTGTAGGDNIQGLEGNDVINAGEGSDYANGAQGSDTLNGEGGDDRLEGGEGDDTLNGGAQSEFGGDQAVYYGAASGVTVDLNIQGVAQNTVGAGMDTLIGIESAHGSAHNDTLIGDGQNNYLGGGGGNDNLSGNGGNDTLEGGQGNDTIFGGGGDDGRSRRCSVGGAGGWRASRITGQPRVAERPTKRHAKLMWLSVGTHSLKR